MFCCYKNFPNISARKPNIFSIKQFRSQNLSLQLRNAKNVFLPNESIKQLHPRNPTRLQATSPRADQGPPSDRPR